MGQHLSGAGRKLWSRQPTGQGSRGVATNVVELESQRTKRLASRFRAARAASDDPVGTSRLDVIGGRTRQLSGHSNLFGRPAGPARESGNDHGHRTRGRRACAKVGAAASVRAGTCAGLR